MSIVVSVTIINHDRDGQTDRQTSGKSGEDLNLEVHLPALATAAMAARQTEEVLVLLTTDKTRVATRRRSYALHTSVSSHDS